MSAMIFAALVIIVLMMMVLTMAVATTGLMFVGLVVLVLFLATRLHEATAQLGQAQHERDACARELELGALAERVLAEQERRPELCLRRFPRDAARHIPKLPS